MRNWLLALKLLAGLALIYVIMLRVDASVVAKAMLGAKLLHLALACLFVAIAVVSNAVRWRVVTQGVERGISMRTAIIGYFESMFFNQILPTGIGGDAIRVVRAYDSGIAAGWSIVGVIIDRAFGLLTVAVLLISAWAIGGSGVVTANLFGWLVATAAIVVLGAAVAAGLGGVVGHWPLPRWTAPFVSLLTAFTRVLTRYAGLAAIIATSLLSSAAMAAALVACADSIGVDLGFWSALVAMQGILLAALVPISIGGWGVREGVLILLLAPLAIAADKAVAVSVMFGLVLTAIGVAGSVVWILSDYRRVNLADRLTLIRRKSAAG